MADNLFTSERFDMISDYLKEHGRATVDELAKVLYVSQATVRRDLNEMQKLGIIQRTHGGAVFVDNVDEVNIFVRIEKNTADKQKAVEIALDRLPPFNTVFIDNSSTCLALAERMNFQYKTIITNGLQLAVKLSNRKDVKVIFLGGVIQYSSYSTDGSLATEMLDRFHMDLMLSSCAAIREDGTYEPTIETMQIKSAALMRSDKKVLVVDKNKFSLSLPYRVKDLGFYDAIYTNASDEVIDSYKKKGINIINKA